MQLVIILCLRMYIDKFGKTIAATFTKPLSLHHHLESDRHNATVQHDPKFETADETMALLIRSVFKAIQQASVKYS